LNDPVTDTDPTPTGAGANDADISGADANDAVWKSTEAVEQWAATAQEREQKRAWHVRILGELLPFGEQDEFTFLDLGAGTGAASRVLLQLYPRSTAILADYSSQMMDEGARAMAPFDGRFRYVEFDMSTPIWPTAIPRAVDAVVTSLSVHHLPDDRKLGLFAEIFGRLLPGGWYLNYDPVASVDPLVEAAWARVNERLDPDLERRRLNPTPIEHARHQNHVRYIVPLDQQLDYLRAAGFAAVDVYWKHLDNVIYGGFRPN
jgi:tRNA (cmo5U34)-methyltransferase